MTLIEAFYLFILPTIIALCALGGIAYLRATDNRDKLHPGE